MKARPLPPVPKRRKSLPRQSHTSSYDSGTRAFTWADTGTGEMHYTHHPSGIFEMCGCKKPHDGIPCLVDKLIWDKRYRRKFRCMIQNDEGIYLLAAAQWTMERVVEGIVEKPWNYFAQICSRERWNRTKKSIIKQGRHKRFELRDEVMYHEISTERKFRAKVDWQDHPEACDEWKGALDKDGYGRHYVNGKEVRAHRWWYQFKHGPIPDDWDVDHTCGIRHCMKHLVAKPRDVNRSRIENSRAEQRKRSRLINEALRLDLTTVACRGVMCQGRVTGFFIGKERVAYVCAEHRDQYEDRLEYIPASQAMERVIVDVVSDTGWDEVIAEMTPFRSRGDVLGSQDDGAAVDDGAEGTQVNNDDAVINSDDPDDVTSRFAGVPTRGAQEGSLYIVGSGGPHGSRQEYLQLLEELATLWDIESAGVEERMRELHISGRAKMIHWLRKQISIDVHEALGEEQDIATTR